MNAHFPTSNPLQPLNRIKIPSTRVLILPMYLCMRSYLMPVKDSSRTSSAPWSPR